MITIIGSINFDLISYCEKLPKTGETILGSKVIMASGGKGANQALAAMRAGAKVKFYGAVGNDEFAKLALSELKAQGADLSNVKQYNCATGLANITVDAKGNNIIIVVAGANKKIDIGVAKTAIKNMKQGDILLLNQEIPPKVIKTALEMSKKANILSILNIAPFIKETKQLAALSDVLIANEVEFNALVGKKIAFENIFEQVKKYAKENQQIIIITLGENGAIYADQENFGHIKAPKISAIDTVGAGDCFCGVFANSLEAEFPLRKAIKTAVFAGALATLKTGAQTSFPNKSEIAKFIKNKSH